MGLLGTSIIDKVCTKNANGDIQLEEYVECPTNSCGCDLRKEKWDRLYIQDQLIMHIEIIK